MIEDNGHIEQIFRDKFSDYSVQPSPGLWGKIAGNLFWKEFLSFDISSFNVYYLSAAVGVIATGIVLLSGSSDSKISQDFPENNLEPPETTLKQYETVQDQSEIAAVKEALETPEIIPEEKPVSETESVRAIEEVKGSDKDKLEPLETTLKQFVTDDQGAEDATLILKPPIAEYSASATIGCGALTVQFTNQSKFADRYVWHFGDGESSTEENPTYIYDETGEYEVRLEATGAGGEANIAKETIRVFEPPEANFVISPKDATIPEEPVTFYNHSKNASRYRWDFGDLSTSTETEPTHYYMESGKYDIRLDVWNEAGCHDSLIIQDAFASSGCRIEFPTAFAPNPNGPSNGYYTDGPTGNEVFHPVYQGVAEYRLRIYNRNSALVFESNDINIGWDGYIKGALAKQDVYVWKVSGRFRNGKTFTEQGNVTLIVKR
jgi:PKD repeat protein